MILGTAAYMSPEQARGKAVDKRADIWAFGVVLYEMLTGARAFLGEDVADTLANVINKEPPGKPCPLRYRRVSARRCDCACGSHSASASPTSVPCAWRWRARSRRSRRRRPWPRRRRRHADGWP